MTKCIFVFYFPDIADAELYIDDGTDQAYVTTVCVEHDFAFISTCYLILSYLFLSFQKKIYQRPDAE